MKLFLSPTTFFETKNGLDISLPLSPNKGATAWYCDPIKIWPVEGDDFIGKVSLGGSTNFNNIQLNPHGNGTHTENVGHISTEFHSINDSLTDFHFYTNLITITPKPFYNTNWEQHDLIIDADLIQTALKGKNNLDTLIIRTIPNSNLKKEKNYSNSNPPYLTKDAMEFINKIGVTHLLIDLPSVDRENDHGLLVAHKTFWNYPEQPILDKTITELIFVDNAIKDDTYILQIQIISLENDASPSKPILYKIESL